MKLILEIFACLSLTAMLVDSAGGRKTLNLPCGGKQDCGEGQFCLRNRCACNPGTADVLAGMPGDAVERGLDGAAPRSDVAGRDGRAGAAE